MSQPQPSAPIADHPDHMNLVERNSYYRDGYRRALTIVLAQLLAIVILIFAGYEMVQKQRGQIRFFPADEYGAPLRPMPTSIAYIHYFNRELSRDRTHAGRWMDCSPQPPPPKGDPSKCAEAVETWAEDAIAETMSFGYQDFRIRLQDASAHFTQSGWRKFQAELARSKLLDQIEDNKRVVKIEFIRKPRIITQGVDAGIYIWNIEAIVEVRYIGKANTLIEKQRVNLKALRVPILENPRAVAIDQWIATKYESPRR